ncbi:MULTISPECIES: cysteine protease StiP family protein [unclassified Acinetobacter]|uniref:cysteine protease StiP family protein n=1 Tax=unclassified Acinetobacter TaxID=196816 RepID=UPI0035B90AEE
MPIDLTTAEQDALFATAFSGSYQPSQVQFLLQKMQLENTDPAEKERLIQLGQKHYSQMISHEKPPSDEHLNLYRQALAQEGERYALQVAQLANRLAVHYTGDEPIILVSLVRAGVPLGVLLKDALSDVNKNSVHYGISIIRDRGIDFAALESIIAKHGAERLIFVDGWTGKGAIKGELMRSIGQDARFLDAMQKYGHDDLPLVTLADVAGVSWLSASGEDWLIPSGILGSTISGLISRSICVGDALQQHEINQENISEWHGCIEYEHLRAFDISQDFVAHINQIRQDLAKKQGGFFALGQATWTAAQRQQQALQSSQVVQNIAKQFDIENLNRIKPGIAEATRAILRRMPEMVILREADNPNTALLRYLTEKTSTPVIIMPDIAPYHAVTIIQKIGNVAD